MSKIPYRFRQENKCIFLFNIKGAIEVANTKLSPRDAIGIWDTDNITIQVQPNTEFVLIEAPVNL